MNQYATDISCDHSLFPIQLLCIHPKILERRVYCTVQHNVLNYRFQLSDFTLASFISDC